MLQTVETNILICFYLLGLISGASLTLIVAALTRKSRYDYED